ncbi:putative toxin-antitoxin system toxin component, PIN family [Pseudanabaena sp. SR411]|uniref:putative toxin-antitoxin system toxin component, PIN family n=1 Tax=Pseudanabaena sp. SR411 TaxID=1980935 RepID=UPI000B98EE68|nr:putative toxin-antitoxin system toxin component, PIN family [Pseudanabaena sp. SR411]OYQ65276.1 putative toxin-antitoxin system toxin component, PIN family [Pseudanabaena sp. SR411]
MTNSSIRLVLDTNVLVSAILSPASMSAKILNWGEDNGVILYSTATLTEVLSVLGRSKFSKYIDHDDIDGLSIRIKTVWLFDEILNQVQLCRDPKDDKFIDLALNGEASHLITGDSDLLVLNPIQNTSVINPRTFWGEIIKL